MVKNETVVGIIHDDDIVTDTIRSVCENAGFSSIASKNLSDVTADPKFPEEYRTFLRVFRPDLIVFGVPHPYRENWRCVDRLINLDESKGREFLLITTDREQVQALAGSANTIEILEEPFDVDSLVAAIHRTHQSWQAKKLGNSSSPANIAPDMQSADGI